MLHKYLRPRFAPGAPRRKHRRDRGERLQSGRDGKGGGSLGTPGGTHQLITCLPLGSRAQERQLASQLADPGIQNSRFGPITVGCRQPARLRLPQPTQTRPARELPRTYPGSRLCSPDPGRALPSLGAQSPHCPASATAPRPHITLALSARSRPQRPGHEPSATWHLPRQSGRASTLPHYTSPRPHYPAHKQPLPTQHTS